MFGPGGRGGGGGGGGRFRWIVQRFKEKGATSPDKAMTAEELGLPPKFEEAMHRRLGATGIFVEVSGKYYLDEAKLQQVEEQRRAMGGGGMGGGGWGQGGSMLALGIARRTIGIIVILLVITNILVVRSLDVSILVAALLGVWVVLSVYQLMRLSRRRKRWSSGTGGNFSDATNPP
jgi:hypothetical protein